MEIQAAKTTEWKKGNHHRIYVQATWTYNEYGARVAPREIGYYDVVAEKAVPARGYSDECYLAFIEAQAPKTETPVETKPPAPKQAQAELCESCNCERIIGQRRCYNCGSNY